MEDENLGNGVQPSRLPTALKTQTSKGYFLWYGQREARTQYDSIEKHLYPLTEIEKAFMGDELQVGDCNVCPSQRILFRLLKNIGINLNYIIVKCLRHTP